MVQALTGAERRDHGPDTATAAVGSGRPDRSIPCVCDNRVTSTARVHESPVALNPFRFLRRVTARLNSIGWFRAAGSLSFVTLLALVPLATVAFAFVAQFPIFQAFVKVLETFLLRHLLPSSASAIVREYVVVLAEGAASVIGPSIIFVAVTGVLMVDTIESEINEIWGIRVKRPVGRRILVYLVGITAGPVMVGGAISLFRWTLTEVVTAVSLQQGVTEAVSSFVPTTLVVFALVLLYRVAPARKVRWRYAIASGVLAGLALEATKRIFTWYLTNFPGYELLYGALAAFPALLFWIFLCWLIVLAGAAVTATLAEAGERRKAATL